MDMLSGAITQKRKVSCPPALRTIFSGGGGVLSYSLLFLIIASVIVFSCFAFNKTLLTTGDGMDQWYPRLLKLRSLIIDFVSGNGFPLWSWEFGFGDDTFGTLSYLIFDPIAWIVVFFPVEAADICYSVMCLIKMYLAGLVMFLFLTKSRHLSSQTSTAFALMYAFSFWAFDSLNHVMFPNSLVLFPLLIMGIDKVDDGGSPVLLIITTVFAILNYLYFAYMLAIGCLVYVVIKSITIYKNKGVKFKLKRYLKLSSLVVISLLISLPFFIPIANSFLSTSTSSSVAVELFPTLNYFLKFLPQLGSQAYGSTSYDHIGVYGIALALIPLVILNLRKNLDGKLFVIFLLIDSFPIGQSIMNGGSYPSSRFAFIVVFFCLSACALQYDKYGEAIAIKKKQIGAFLLTTFIFAILCAAFGVGSLKSLVFLSVNIIFSLLLGFRKQNGPNDIICVSFLNIVMIIFLLFSPSVFSFLSEKADIGSAYNLHEQSSLNNLKGINYSDMFRVDTLNSSGRRSGKIGTSTKRATSSEYVGIPTVSSYNSITDSKLHIFYSSLEINKGSAHRVLLGGNDNRPGIDYLLGVKYFTFYKNDDKYKILSPNSNFKKTKSDGVMKSKFAPSIGYVFNSRLSEPEFSELSSIDKEQLLLNSVVTKSNERSRENESFDCQSKVIDVAISGDNYFEDDGSKKFISDTNNQKLYLNIDKENEKQDIYVRLKNIKRKKANSAEERSYKIAKFNNLSKFWNDSMWQVSELWQRKYQNFSIDVKYFNVNKNILNSDGDAWAYSKTDDNYTVYLGQHKEGKDEIELTFNTLGEYTWDDIEVIAVPKDAMADDMKKLEQTRLKDVKKTKNRIKGNVTSENGGVLFLSIPYNPGWQVYIDGQRQETFLCNIAFTGVNITPGDHKVELKYRPIGMPYTFIASGIGVLILICICIYIRRKNKKNGGGDGAKKVS